jgi:hypothetical protein
MKNSQKILELQVLISSVKNGAEVYKAATEWLTHLKDFTWEGDFYFEDDDEAIVTFLKAEGLESKEVEVEFIMSYNHAQVVGSQWVKQNPGWEWHGRYVTKIKGSKSAIFVRRRVEARNIEMGKQDQEEDDKDDEPDNKKVKI